MKKLVAAACLILFSTTAKAQFFDSHAVYASSRISLGNYVGASVNLNYVYQEKHSLKAGLSGLIRSAASMPNDYSGGLLNVIVLGLLSPFDDLESYELLYGRIVQMNEARTIRFNIRGGLVYSTYRTPTNWVKNNDSFYLLPNYSFDIERNRLIGLKLNPEVEFPISRYFGFSISPFALVNKETVAAGLELGIMFGVLRGKKPAQL